MVYVNSHTSTQGEFFPEEYPFTPLLVPAFIFYSGACAEEEKVLQVYTRKKKMTTTDAPLVLH